MIFDDFVFDLFVSVVDDLGGAVFISDPKKPASGDVLAHLATIRLIFRKDR